MLAVERLSARYGSITAVREVSLRVGAGEVVGLIGPNGAGKTTLLSTVAGLLDPAGGRVELEGSDVTGAPPDRMLRSGVALVPERRRLFADLTVEENLLVAGITATGAERRERLSEVVELFPVLGEKWRAQAGYLSGGEAQQLAIARALMSNPRLILMDEPTLGLAPVLVDVVFELIGRLREEGRTLLVVEQNARRLLEAADRAYVLRTGTIVAEGAGAELLGRPDLFAAYVGASPEERGAGA
ncbi:MAG: ABC transporter ATP-binding protein [Thermoleophilia bacterium]|nr:ABC transporter ATP-binding protein [Thermoleophilia bacterium]